MQYKIIVVGSFLAEEKRIFGGVARSCQTMMQSSFADRFEIIPVDSTQISNPPPGLMMRFLLAFKRMAIYKVELIKHRPDAILLFTSVGLSFIEKCMMGWIARFFGRPVLIFPRGGELINQARRSSFKRVIFQLLLKGSRIFLAQGPKWQDFAVNDMGFKPSQVHQIPNWTATECHLSIGSKRDCNLTKKIPRLLFVGWLEEFKGVFELLKACQMLVNKGIKFELTLAGRGHAEVEARRFVESNGLNKVVTFSGWAEPIELEQLLSTHDIFVLPSWAEGMPNSMIEAMAAGLAVVVTTVGMVADFLQNEEHALLVPPHNVELLEEALQQIILDDSLRKRLAINGYQLAKTQFAVEPAMKKLGDIVESAITG